VTFGTNLEPQPSLAESWELAKDGTSATFRLRENVRTHSGGAFDADAVLANFQRVKDKATGGGLFSRLEDFTAADKLDARSVRFRFARPRPDFLAMVSRWGMADPAAFATLKQKGGGTGPFKLAEWVPGDHLTFVRNDGYWQAGLPYLDRVVFRVLSDAGAMENAFRAGQIDVAHTIPNKDAQRLRGEGLQVQPAPVPNEYYVVILNTRKPPFDNLKVRQAMRYLLDRETIPRRSWAASARPRCRSPRPARRRTTRSSTRSSRSTPRRPASSSPRRGSPARPRRCRDSCRPARRRARRSRRSSRRTSRRSASR
jgi:peptide/nickel transport system substrate-binding protein